MEIDGLLLERGPLETLTVTTSDLRGDPYYLQFWPSGFSSDYTVSSAGYPPGTEPVVGGVEVWRFSVTFSADSGDLWGDFALPTTADFFDSIIFNGLILDTFGAGGGGAISSLTATVVPLPAMWPGLLLAAGLVRRQRTGATP